MAACPSLLQLSLNKLANSIDKVPSLDGLPEELAVALFDEVFRRGKFSPRVLEMFEATQHAHVLSRIKMLNIQYWVPPVLPDTRNTWLGDKPHYFR
ncbi:hypothetical protein WJX72_004248 [[Myrmecia] bisecta]|uniref:Uncharacterized protein n=1 Tax=[Myrmecia] bisecta TaxID=41462 RepID=A0AAW1R6L2_9CHLO